MLVVGTILSLIMTEPSVLTEGSYKVRCDWTNKHPQVLPMNEALLAEPKQDTFQWPAFPSLTYLQWNIWGGWSVITTPDMVRHTSAPSPNLHAQELTQHFSLDRFLCWDPPPKHQTLSTSSKTSKIHPKQCHVELPQLLIPVSCLLPQCTVSAVTTAGPPHHNHRRFLVCLYYAQVAKSHFSEVDKFLHHHLDNRPPSLPLIACSTENFPLYPLQAISSFRGWKL